MDAVKVLTALQLVVDNLPKELVNPIEAAIKKKVDEIIDDIEEYYEGTETKVDDMVLGLLCKAIRMSANIPDND